MSGAPPAVRRAIQALLLAGFLSYLALLCMRPNWDIDIFWHVRTGEWIAQHLALPHTDLFSSTDTARPWTPFQWLYELLCYEVQAYLGFFWVRVLHAALFVAAFVALQRAYARIGLGRVAAWALLILTLLMTEDRLRVRPEAFNLLFTALLLPLLAGLAGTPRVSWRMLAGIAVIAALWANLHAGGALFLPLAASAVLAGRVVSRLARPDDGDARDALASAAKVLAASTLPMLPMPGFLQGSWTALSMLEESAILIPEWHPPVAYFVPGMAGKLTAHHVVAGGVPYLVLVVVGVLVVAGLARGWREYARRHDPARMALVLLLVVLAAKSARFIYLDGLAVAVLVLDYRRAVGERLAHVGVRMALLIACALGLGVSWGYSILQQRHGLARALDTVAVDLEPGTFPERASDAIGGMGLKGRILHLTAWGGFLVGRHWPDCSVIADGRGNFTADERQVIVSIHHPYEREEALEEAYAKYPYEIVVLPPPVFPLLDWDRSKWLLAWRDEVAEAFVRRDADGGANERRVLAWWAAMGIDAGGDPIDFQERYQRVLGLRYLENVEVARKLKMAAADAFSGEPGRETEGQYQAALTLFAGGFWHESARALRKVEKVGVRHGTATLYLAWSEYLLGHRDRAREILRTGFVDLDPAVAAQPDRGPLKWGGRRILELLERKLGLPVTPTS